jgi:hypothetical protein
VGRDLGLDFAIVPGCRDAVVLNQKRRISNYAQLVELRTHARTSGSRKRYELSDVDDGKRSGCCHFSAMGM